MFELIQGGRSYVPRPPLSKEQRTEIGRTVTARFGGETMHIDQPQFCENCKQYQKFEESPYCRRCLAMMANAAKRTPIGRTGYLLITLAVGAAMMILTSFCSPPRKAAVIKHDSTNITARDARRIGP